MSHQETEKKAKVLVVDDDIDVTLILSTLLEQDGHSVVVALSGAEVLDMLGLDDSTHAGLSIRPDLVLLDIMMPGLDGYQVCERIKRDLSFIPVIMLTVRDSSEDKVKGLNCGADDYITKPFTSQELLARVRAMLRIKRLQEKSWRREEQLRESEEWYRTLVETMKDGLAVIDENMKLTFVNDKFCQMLGFAKHKMIGCSALDFHDKANKRALEEQMSKWHYSEQSIFEIAITRKDGQQIPVLISPSPILDQEGHFKGHSVVVTDITQHKQAEEARLKQVEAEARAESAEAAKRRLEEEIVERKRAERALRASEEKFRSLVESAQDIIFLQDPQDGRFTFMHIPEHHLTRPDAFVGEEPRDVLPPDLADLCLMYAHQVTRDSAPRTYENDVTWNGKPMSFLITLSPIKDNGGGVASVMGVARDITEWKRAQARLIQAERLTAIGRLAASVAHEINNPLQSVIGCLGLAQEVLAEGEGVGQYLQVAHEELRRVAKIVGRMRDLYRPTVEKKTPTKLNALLEQLLQLTRQKCEENQVDVVWQPADDLPLLLLVPDQIRQVFLNLALNALEAMPKGGQLQVSTTRTNHPLGVCIRFTDNGLGIAPNDLSRIFEPFYSAKPRGDGLGLSICHELVERHGGYIEVNSQIGEGSTFAVWLPA